MRDLAVDDVTAGFGNLEPLDVLDALAALGNRVIDGILDAGGGRTDQFDFLVGVMF